MLKSLQLENYRGFRQYRLDGLARVNLLVGKNNCGKTSILEAVQILAAQGDPRALSEIAMRRGEIIAIGDEYPNVTHLFHGHGFVPNVSLSLCGDNGLSHLGMRIARLSDFHEPQRRQFLFPATNIVRGVVPREDMLVEYANSLVIEILGKGQRQPWPLIPVSEDGALLIGPPFYGVGELAGATSVQFITPESVLPGSMGSMWDTVITEGREVDVIRAMKILEPEIANIFFLSGERAPRNGRGGILVGFEDPKRKRVPLGSFGEGLRRMLALALSLDQARGGILLVDEIDTGLHYSILGDMWLLLVNAARQYDVQVFATTHSLDCIRGLAWLCERHPELADDVSLQKIDASLDEAVAFDSGEIQIAVEQDLEVR